MQSLPPSRAVEQSSRGESRNAAVWYIYIPQRNATREEEEKVSPRDPFPPFSNYIMYDHICPLHHVIYETTHEIYFRCSCQRIQTIQCINEFSSVNSQSIQLKSRIGNDLVDSM